MNKEYLGENPRIIALANFLGEPYENFTEAHYDDTIIEYGKKEYYVLTDREADDLQDRMLDDYIEDCLEIPKSIRRYFDEEAWKSDARDDGRGHCISSYDGYENENTIDVDDGDYEESGMDVGWTGEETYYIYRIN